MTLYSNLISTQRFSVILNYFNVLFFYFIFFCNCLYINLLADKDVEQKMCDDRYYNDGISFDIFSHLDEFISR